MRLEDAFVGPLENTVIVNASQGAGIFLMPYWAHDLRRLDCLMLEWAPSGAVVRHNYENVGVRTDLNFAEWNQLAGEYALQSEGWKRYRLDIEGSQQ